MLHTINHARPQVVLHHFPRNCLYRRFHGSKLDKNVSAVAIILNHYFNTTELSDYAIDTP